MAAAWAGAGDPGARLAPAPAPKLAEVALNLTRPALFNPQATPAEDAMLDFRPRKDNAQPSFSLNPADHVRARAPMGKRRVWHLISLMVVMLVTGGMFYNWLTTLRTSMTPGTEPLKRELAAAPMRRPTLEGMGEFPATAQIAAEAANAAEKGGSAPLWIDQPDAFTLAWTLARLAEDRATPPLPQRVSASDLVLTHVRVGSSILVSGSLVDSRTVSAPGADPAWCCLIVRLEPDQYVEMLAPSTGNDLSVGTEVQVVGRYLGPASLPAAATDQAAAPAGGSAAPAAPGAPPAGKVKLPLIAARVLSAVEAQKTEESPWRMSGAWSLPEDLYGNVDDDLLILETRPYYYTLGQVKLDLTSPDSSILPPSANQHAAELHQTPVPFRGKRYTVHGHVFSAWEDAAVAKDHPFAVDRVVRVIMWSEDWGLFDQLDSKGKVTTSNKLVLRAFEIAAISHQPLPQPGDLITASGRFLRLRAMEVKSDPRRDAALAYRRQSDRAYTFLFVTNEFAILPPPAQYDWTMLSLITLGAALAFAGLILVMTRRESRQQDLVFDSVRKLRTTRSKLRAQRVAPAGPPAAPPSPPDAAPGSAAPDAGPASGTPPGPTLGAG
jgi:hypothetical protein